jgi:hypothetical protein
VIVTQAQIDAAVSERFPVSKKFLMIFEITYSNPQVTLLEDSNQPPFSPPPVRSPAPSTAFTQKAIS